MRLISMIFMFLMTAIFAFAGDPPVIEQAEPQRLVPQSTTPEDWDCGVPRDWAEKRDGNDWNRAVVMHRRLTQSMYCQTGQSFRGVQLVG